MERLRKYTTIFYSTHILDDVQRVSDTVAILNHGQLVAQAPIEELLAGTGSILYHLKFKGDPREGPGLPGRRALDFRHPAIGDQWTDQLAGDRGG